MTDGLFGDRINCEDYEELLLYLDTCPYVELTRKIKVLVHDKILDIDSFKVENGQIILIPKSE